MDSNQLRSSGFSWRSCFLATLTMGWGRMLHRARDREERPLFAGASSRMIRQPQMAPVLPARTYSPSMGAAGSARKRPPSVRGPSAERSLELDRRIPTAHLGGQTEFKTVEVVVVVVLTLVFDFGRADRVIERRAWFRISPLKKGFNRGLRGDRLRKLA
jgi:hypothetical protein